MKNIKTLSEKEIIQASSRLNNEFNIDTSYKDFSDVCYCLAANCELMLSYCQGCLGTEKEVLNVEYLRDILETCSKMFLDCDDFYKR